MKRNVNNYKILGILLLISIFTINQVPAKSVWDPRSLVELAALKSAQNILEVYNNEFKSDPKNAFKAMQAYISSQNIPSELLQNIYCAIAHDLKRIDIFLRELILENKDKINLSIFLNLCLDAKYNLAFKLIQISLKKNTKFPDISPEAAEKLLVKILENYQNIEFYDEILAKLLSLYDKYSNYIPNPDEDNKIFLIQGLSSKIREILNSHYKRAIGKTSPKDNELFGQDIERTKNEAMDLVKAFDGDNKIKANNILKQLSEEDQDHILNYIFDRYFEENQDYLDKIPEFIDFLFPEKDKAHNKILALYLRLEKLYPQFTKLLYLKNAVIFGAKVDMLLSLHIYLMDYYEKKILNLFIDNPETEKMRAKVYSDIKNLLLEEYLSLGVKHVNQTLSALLKDIEKFSDPSVLSDNKLVKSLQLLTNKKRIKILEVIKGWIQDMISENKLPKEDTEDIVKDYISGINSFLFKTRLEEDTEKEV